MSMTAKSSVDSVRLEVIAGMPLPIPLLPEQRAIAAALSDVDDLLQSLDRLIAKKRDVKQGAMQQLLTGTTRLPGFEGAWETKQLGDVARLMPGINKPASAMGTGTPYVTVQQLYEPKWVDQSACARIELSEAERERFVLRPLDVLFGKSSVKREGIGYPCIFEGSNAPVSWSGFAFATRADPNHIDPEFLFYSLRSGPTRGWVIGNSQASALTNLNAGIARAIPVLLPPLPEQRAIAAVLSDMDTGIDAFQQRRVKVASIKQGMMQELLTGRTRLPIPQEVTA